MEENERRRVESKVNEENQRKSRCVEAAEKGVEASAQVESNGKWISRHTLVAFEVLGQWVENQEGGTVITDNCKYTSHNTLHS